MALPEGERPTLAQAASMIDAAMEAADRFYPAFDFLLDGRQVARGGDRRLHVRDRRPGLIRPAHDADPAHRRRTHGRRAGRRAGCAPAPSPASDLLIRDPGARRRGCWPRGALLNPRRGDDRAGQDRAAGGQAADLARGRRRGRAACWRADAVIVSIAAGVATADIAAAFGGRRVARVMPTTAVAIGQGTAIDLRRRSRGPRPRPRPVRRRSAPSSISTTRT